MFCNSALVHSANLLLTFVLAATVNAQVQNTIALAQPRHSVSVLDSTREQDGLVGAVRRVKTESAKVEIKEGQASQGTLELLELTTYGVKGNRVENISYPVADSQIGKEEYKYDDRGNITEMIMRDDRGAIVSRESYSYEFDAVGNWIKMTTSLVLVEAGKIKQEPIETTYRTITYYYTDDIAKTVDGPKPNVVSLPVPTSELATLEPLKLHDVTFNAKDGGSLMTPGTLGDAPTLAVRRSEPVIQKGAIPVSRQSDAGSRHSSTVNSAVESVPVNNPPTEDSLQRVAFGLYEKGLSFLESGDPQGAIEAFLSSLKLISSPEVFRSLGDAYLKTEKNNSALKAFKDSINLDSNSAESQYGLGLAAFRLRRYQDARNAFKQATTLKPNMAKAHYGLGLTYLELGQPDATTVEVRTLQNLDKNLAKQLASASPERGYTCRFSVCQ